MKIACSLVKIEPIERTEAAEEEEENCKRENICSTFYSRSRVRRASSCMYRSIAIFIPAYDMDFAFDACSIAECVCVFSFVALPWRLVCAWLLDQSAYNILYIYMVCTQLILVWISLTFAEQNWIDILFQAFWQMNEEHCGWFSDEYAVKSECAAEKNHSD